MNKIAVGQRGEGKTTLAMWDLRQRHKGIVGFDPRHMIEGNVVYDTEELEEKITEASEQQQSDGEVRDIPPIIYRPDASNIDDEFTAFCDVVLPPHYPFGGFGVLIDEAGRLQTAQSAHPELARVITQHPLKPPGHAISIFQTMHTLGASWSQGRSLIDELYMFRLTAPGDVKAILDYTGDPALVDIIRDLPQHVCIRYWNSRRPPGAPQWVIMDDPKVWHIRATIHDEKGKKVLDSQTEWVSDGPVRVL